MCVRFSADGKFLASTGGDKVAYLYEIPNGNVVNKITHHDRYVGSCAFSRNGMFLATGSNDKQVAIWRLDSKDVNQRHTEEDSNTQLALNGDSSGTSLDEDIGIGDFFGTDSLLLYLFRISWGSA